MTALVLRVRQAHIRASPGCRPEIRLSLSGCNQGIPLTLKGSAMTPKFLREEAARFRGMAETAEREASKQRLLTMAIDYEAKANAAEEVTEPDVNAPIKAKVGKKAVASAAP
jgi:hypothetical protein